MASTCVFRGKPSETVVKEFRMFRHPNFDIRQCRPINDPL